MTYVHPIVYQPPHLDEQTILVNELQTSHVVELPAEEGEELLQELFARLYAPEFVYRHEWRPNDIIIWDNLALQHCRPTEMGTVRRHLRRSPSTAGTPTTACSSGTIPSSTTPDRGRDRRRLMRRTPSDTRGRRRGDRP